MLLIICLFLGTSCQRDLGIKFNKAGWNTKDDFDYPNRELMVNDLVKNHQLKGLTYQQLLDSVGQLSLDTATHEGYYDIVIDFGSDIDPVYTKDLVVKFNKDSVVTGFEIKEWKKE